MNAGLTQVLADRTNTYLYGNGRISQHATQTEYFLGDALGSVRQLADATSAVTLTQSYAPYGGTVSSTGSGTSAYQFTGEMRDANGLTYLRARYLDSSTGRFTQRDPSRMEANLYLYAGANPVNRIDPTGLYSRFDAVIFAYKHDLNTDLGTNINGTQCANFASFVLYAGGIRDTRPEPRIQLKFDNDDAEAFQGMQPPYWDPNIMKTDNVFEKYRHMFLQEWYDTDHLLDFLVKNGHADTRTYSGVVPHFNSAFATADNVNRNNQEWKEFLRINKSFIQPGDLVFYDSAETNYAEWEHVAVVTDWSIQTYMDKQGTDPWNRIAMEMYYSVIAPYDCGFDWDMVKPRVVEQGGSINYQTNRSVDNTGSRSKSIMFVHIR